MASLKLRGHREMIMSTITGPIAGNTLRHSEDGIMSCGLEVMFIFLVIWSSWRLIGWKDSRAMGLFGKKSVSMRVWTRLNIFEWMVITLSTRNE